MGKRLIVLAVVIVAFVANVTAQTRTRNVKTPAPTLLASLPESDGVAHVKIKQLINDTIPRLLANNPTRLAEVNAEIEKYKTKTGLDPRSFDEVAISVRYTYPREDITKLQTIALARGSFNAGAIVAAGRIAADGKYREEKYLDKTIYIFNLDENIKLLGLFDFSIKEIAVCPLDSNTLAISDPVNIRSAIDVKRNKKRVNAELIALASHDPNAVVGFGSNMTPQLMRNLNIPNATVANDVSAIRQVYGSVATPEANVDFFLGAKALNSEAARNLGDTLEGLKQLGAIFIGRIAGAKGVLAKSALSNLKIVTQANELQIRTSVPQADIAPLFGD